MQIANYAKRLQTLASCFSPLGGGACDTSSFNSLLYAEVDDNIFLCCSYLIFLRQELSETLAFATPAILAGYRALRIHLSSSPLLQPHTDVHCHVLLLCGNWGSKARASGLHSELCKHSASSRVPEYTFVLFPSLWTMPHHTDSALWGALTRLGAPAQAHWREGYVEESLNDFHDPLIIRSSFIPQPVLCGLLMYTVCSLLHDGI